MYWVQIARERIPPEGTRPKSLMNSRWTKLIADQQRDRFKFDSEEFDFSRVHDFLRFLFEVISWAFFFSYHLFD